MSLVRHESITGCDLSSRGHLLETTQIKSKTFHNNGFSDTTITANLEPRLCNDATYCDHHTMKGWHRTTQWTNTKHKNPFLRCTLLCCTKTVNHRAHCYLLVQIKQNPKLVCNPIWPHIVGFLILSQVDESLSTQRRLEERLRSWNKNWWSYGTTVTMKDSLETEWTNTKKCLTSPCPSPPVGYIPFLAQHSEEISQLANSNKPIAVEVYLCEGLRQSNLANCALVC